MRGRGDDADASFCSDPFKQGSVDLRLQFCVPVLSGSRISSQARIEASLLSRGLFVVSGAR
jgi:hypothetical protein